MNIIQVDQKTCSQCGICAEACGRGLIDFQVNNYPEPNTVAESECITCGHCVVVCPTGSLTHRDMPVEKCPTIQESLRITAEQCEHFLKSRRSIREYENKPVPRDVIAQLIETARYAPTGHNDQDVEWLVIDNREDLRRLRRIGVDWLNWISSNQPQVASSLNIERMLERDKNGENVLLRDAPVIVVAHADKNSLIAIVNCTIALSYFDLAAKSVGLGCCWNGYLYFIANSFPPMQEALSLPEGHAAYAFMMMGYPKLSYHRIPLRKSPRITWR